MLVFAFYEGVGFRWKCYFKDIHCDFWYFYILIYLSNFVYIHKATYWYILVISSLIHVNDSVPHIQKMKTRLYFLPAVSNKVKRMCRIANMKE